MKNIVILTGNELRHQYFRKKLSNDKNINVITSYCESESNSLENRINKDELSSNLMKKHVKTRTQVENDFFGDYVNEITDLSNPTIIPKGDINSDQIVEEIINLNPDLLICYGSSLIKSNLLEIFNKKFLNVHLGLSPYYVGSGTNTWPLINFEPEYVGATFMYIDAGIDTGDIIHQIRAKVFYSDSCHLIGNRLIKDMTNEFIKIINQFDELKEMPQISSQKVLSYKNKDFDAKSCKKLYYNFNDDMISIYLNEYKERVIKVPIIKNTSII